MTFCTVDIAMGSLQGEFRLIMYKTRCGSEGICSVTIRTACRKSILMIIVMAGEALVSQSQIRAFALPQLPVGNEVSLVTFLAFKIPVCSG